ncbi:cold shock domain-containing protein [Streptomyces coeruleorubidus]|uniref:cold shock domain-containing protein n=1 Tax=Streptomyces coeruleorubidus TaxID=116188 RepID=UPI0033E63A40
MVDVQTRGRRHRDGVFIEQDGGGPDVFAHYSNIAAQGFRELQEGQKVTFDVTQGQKGPQAENIRPV